MGEKLDIFNLSLVENKVKAHGEWALAWMRVLGCHDFR